MKHTKQKSGFTLVEVMVATVLLATVLLPLLQIYPNMLVMIEKNRTMTKATYLANEIKEWSGYLKARQRHLYASGAYKSIWDLHGEVFSPPVSAPDMSNPTSPTVLSDHTGWSQTVTLSRRTEGNPAVVDSLGTSKLVELKCVVKYEGQTIHELVWLEKEEAIIP
ncbi:MAG: prepilin-type N-terminal cleavage/methylation domain-containing protein [Phycisphaerales bacterium]|jgi:prepilin-type N-terminal cleavage/methylation domain-containing protein|nr:prepilin-type N-terminal cleavage/methylation domain-containing protein [Phycisphaerales bacterium]MBT7170653.1 prepilin-type N-terminal cleavage/methylation domain-containing protein [Phycisphaerales bacterium]